MIDSDDRIAEANPALAEMLGWSREELRGRELSSFGQDLVEASLHRELIQETRSSYCVEKRYQCKHDGYLWGRTTVWVRPAHERDRCAIGMIEDITREKSAEGHLRDQETVAEIGKMATIVAHQVKNPLAGISGALQIIQDRFPAASDERGILTAIQQRLYDLDQTVDAIVGYARAGQPQLTRLSISHVVSHAVDEILAAYPEISVEVSGTEDLEIAADATMLNVLFSQLLQNAAEAMNGSGEISVYIRAEGRSCLVAVRDHGAGVPAEHREQLFAPFFTTKSRATGLGLALALRIARAHGGDISHEPTSSGGATFVVQLASRRP